MAEDIREIELDNLQSFDYVRVLSSLKSGKIHGNDFMKYLNILSPNNALLLDGDDNMNSLGTCLFWGFVENGLPASAPFNRFSGISMLIGRHGFQIAFDTGGGMKTRGTYNGGSSWSSWV